MDEQIWARSTQWCGISWNKLLFPNRSKFLNFLRSWCKPNSSLYTLATPGTFSSPKTCNNKNDPLGVALPKQSHLSNTRVFSAQEKYDRRCSLKLFSVSCANRDEGRNKREEKKHLQCENNPRHKKNPTKSSSGEPNIESHTRIHKRVAFWYALDSGKCYVAVSLFFHGSEGERRSGSCLGEPLEGEPAVAQAFGGCGSFLRDELQHGQKKVCEALGLLPRPLVLVLQDLQQTPRLQLGDVLQVTCVDHTVRDGTRIQSTETNQNTNQAFCNPDLRLLNAKIRPTLQ